MRVRITVRLPNGSTENISPHVISQGCSRHWEARRAGPDAAHPSSSGPRRRRGTCGAWRRRPCCPWRTRTSAVGARRMSNCWVPMTWLRSTAVWALASSTMPCTSAPGHAEVLGHPGRCAGPLDVAAVHHELRDRVAGSGVEALGHEDAADHGVGDPVGVAGEHDVDGRVLDGFGDRLDRTLVRRPRGCPRPGSARPPCPGG